MFAFIDHLVAGVASKLDDSDVLPRMAAIILRVQAGCLDAFISLLSIAPLGVLIFTKSNSSVAFPASAWVGSLLLACAGFIFAIFHFRLTLLRAKQITLLMDAHLRELAITSKYLRWVGESMAIFIMMIFVMKEIFILFGSLAMVESPSLGMLSNNPGALGGSMWPFISGLGFGNIYISFVVDLISSVFSSTAWLFLFYSIAAAVNGYVNLCIDTKETAGLLRQMPKAIATQITASTGGRP